MAHDLDDDIKTRIRCRVAAHLRAEGLSPQHRDDLEQNLALAVVAQLHRYDPARGCRSTFIAAVIENALKNLRRDGCAAKRACHSTHQLDESRQPGGPTPEQTDLTVDVALVLAGLSAAQRDLAERLPYQTVSAIARDLAQPRSTVNDAVARLRRVFVRAGLEQYLEPGPSNSNDPV